LTPIHFYFITIQWARRWAGDHLAMFAKIGCVAGAVETFFLCVPVYPAAKMGADI
jgi:hypothetical protein